MSLPERLAAYGETLDPALPLPVEDWNPPSCGAIDMRIARDGTWFHDGRPIVRPALVQLFSRLLRKDDEGYVLVTPVEKVAIMVEDVPFIAVEMTVGGGPALSFRTQTGDVVIADADHPLRFADGDAFIPYVRVRGRLEARLTPSLARDLAVRIEKVDGHHGIRSANGFFTIPGVNPVFES